MSDAAEHGSSAAATHAGARIDVEGLVLRYPALPLQTHSIKAAVFGLFDARLARPVMNDVEALRGLDLVVRDGERVALIGCNGAGKTSLLKAIAGVYPLHAGVVRVCGRIQSLFDLSLGFEGEASGRQNIMYRGLLMGESPDAVRAKEAEIVAFADLGAFIDYPVKAYSAGMLVRLAFAISTAFGGEILLMDEVIGVGDAAFLEKARRRLRDLVSGARIVVWASHDMGSVQQICSRALWLERGRVVQDGAAPDIVAAYLRRETVR